MEFSLYIEKYPCFKSFVYPNQMLEHMTIPQWKKWLKLFSTCDETEHHHNVAALGHWLVESIEVNTVKPGMWLSKGETRAMQKRHDKLLKIKEAFNKYY